MHPRALVAPSAVVAFEADLRIVSWSRVAEELTGTRAEHAIGQYLGDVVRTWEQERNGEQEQPANAPPELPALTPRQEEVLRLLAEGVPAKVIATRLGLAVATVRNHIRAILSQLNAQSQLQAVAQAHQLGIL